MPRWLSSVLSAVLLVAAGMAIVALLVRLDAGRRPSPGSFGVGCPLSHTSGDDPIVHPGEPGRSHLHAFFGNTTTDAWSTRRSLLAGTTTCTDRADLAAVWAPVAVHDGRLIVPEGERTYYFRTAREMATVPADLRAIAGGEGAALTPVWHCGVRTPRSNHPYDCGPYREGAGRDGIIAQADFPWCWDGRLDAPDHRSHLVPGDGRRCPDSHATAIPRISVRVHYGIWDPCSAHGPCGPDPESEPNVDLALSSGPYETFHVDFWNTWRQQRLNELVAGCVRSGDACGIVASTSEV